MYTCVLPKDRGAAINWMAATFRRGRGDRGVGLYGNMGDGKNKLTDRMINILSGSLTESYTKTDQPAIFARTALKQS